MIRRALLFVAALAIPASTALAQETSGGVGAKRVEVTLAPVGGLFFAQPSDKTESRFANYLLGGSITSNPNRWVGIEGDIGYGVGVKQKIDFADISLVGQKTPNMLNYSGNVIVNVNGSNHHAVPYAAAGLGGLTILNTPGTANLGVSTNQTYLTGNVGGGIRVFPSAHWGLRADYRFQMIRNRADAPLFFGTDTRFAHRLYGALVFTY